MTTKKFQFLLLMLLLSTSLYAQTEPISKGSYKLGGGLSFNSSSFEHSKSTNFGVYPSVSYFFTDNILLGASLHYFHNYVKTELPLGTYENSADSYGLGITGTYYFRMQNYHPFIGVSSLFVKESSYSEVKSRVLLEAGVLFLFSKSTGIEPYMAYSWEKQTLGTMSTFQAGLRFNYFIVN